MRENRLIFYDTCNYRDYPVGGQVTSIKKFSQLSVTGISGTWERCIIGWSIL